MSRFKNIEEQVQQALTSLDKTERAKANPFLFTRIMARLEEEKTHWNIISRFLTKPMVVIGTLAVIIIINAIAFLQAPAAPVQVMPQENEQLFASEYDLSDASDGAFLIINENNHEQGDTK